MPTINIEPRGIPHDIQYFLDGSIECFDIPPDVYLWARLFCPNITEIIDGLEKQNFGEIYHSNTLQRWGAEIERHYVEWQETAPLAEYQFCLGYGIQFCGNVDERIRELTNTLVEHDSGIIGTIGYYQELIRHRTPDGLVYYDANKLIERKLGHFESLYRIYQQWEAMPEKPDFTTFQVNYPPRPTRMDLIKSIVPKTVEKKTKKALARSAQLLNTVTHENTTQLFLSGAEVSVTGQKYRFSLTKDEYASLTNGSHGSCRTRVYDAQTDEFIAGLCIYTPNVTVFDHLASIVLHCKSGLEDVVINEANITERGNISLLPQETLDKLNPKKPVIELSDSYDEDSEYEGNTFGTGLHHSAARLSPKLKARIAYLNHQHQEKAIKHFKRKHPFLLEIKQISLPDMHRILPRYM